MMNNKHEALTEERDENTIIAERRSKLAAIREKGVAFPNDFSPQHKAADLHISHGEIEREPLEEQAVHVVVAGRMMLKRVMGKASFATLQQNIVAGVTERCVNCHGPGRVKDVRRVHELSR